MEQLDKGAVLVDPTQIPATWVPGKPPLCIKFVLTVLLKERGALPEFLIQTP
jgi:hypothetical protein